MPDIFDQIDVFDTAATPEKDDIFDQVLPEPERLPTGGGMAEFGKGVISSMLGVGKGVVGTTTTLAGTLPTEKEMYEIYGFTADRPLAKTKARPFVEAKRTIIKAQERFSMTHRGASAWAGRIIGEAISYMGAALAGGYIAGLPGAAMVGFAVEGDNAYDEAIATGASEGQAQTERVIVGSINAAIEALQIGRLMRFHKTGRHSLRAFINAAKKRSLKEMARTGKQFSSELLKISIEEGLEEFSQEGVSIGVPAVLRDEYPRKVDDTPDWWAIGERLGEASLGGMVAGGVLGGAGAVVADIAGPKAPAVIKAEEIIKEISKDKTLAKIQKQLDEAYRNNNVEAFDKAIEKFDSLPATPTKNILQGHAQVLQMEMKNRQVKPVEEITEPVVDPLTKLSRLQEQADQTVIRGEKPSQELLDEIKETKKELQQEIKPKVEKKERLTRKKAFAIGHDVPEILGWSEEQRRDYLERFTGVRSMKDIPKGKKGLDQLRPLVMALRQEMRDAGLEYEAPILPIDEMVETLQRTRKVTAKAPIEELNETGVKKLVRSIKKKVSMIGHSLVRMERFLEGLDGHKEGIFYNTIWLPSKQASEFSDANINRETGVFLSFLESQGIDTVLWMNERTEVPGTKINLTASERVGVYALSQNEQGLKYLNKGMGFSIEQINAIKKVMTEQETGVANWLMEQFEAQWPILQQAAAQAGIDLTTLKKEFRYFPLIRTDVDLELQEDFLSELAEGFRKEGYSPEKGMLEERKARAIGKIELDAFQIYMHNIARVQRFMAMAPVANKLGKILNNRNFKEALNNRTHNQGSKLINTWLKDVIKGTSAKSTTMLGRMLSIMRINGMIYALGYNIPSSLRQTLSGFTALAVDPLMMKHMPMNMANAVTSKGYREMRAFVEQRSPEVANRSMDRDIRRRWNKVAIKRKLTYQQFSKRAGKMLGAFEEGDLKKLWWYYKSGTPFSKSAMRWIRWMDQHTVVVSWKSLYDVAMEKGMDEKKAGQYADKWVGRTQPMANVEWLPQFFRDGPLEKLLSTFQNMINNYGNFYYYDIVQAKKAGEIGWGQVSYRVMFSYILPAILFGMIGRADIPRDWKDLTVDLATYPIAPFIVVGRWIDRMIRGWGNSGTIVETGPEALVGAGRALKAGRFWPFIKNAAKAIGAFTGKIPAQSIRTTEGIIDLTAGETQDPRRLIYSKWALEQNRQTKADRKKRKGGYVY